MTALIIVCIILYCFISFMHWGMSYTLAEEMTSQVHLEIWLVTLFWPLFWCYWVFVDKFSKQIKGVWKRKK